MRQIADREIAYVSGGIWQAILGIYAALEVADAVYTAVKSGVESYNDNREPPNNMGQL